MPEGAVSDVVQQSGGADAVNLFRRQVEAVLVVDQMEHTLAREVHHAQTADTTMTKLNLESNAQANARTCARSACGWRRGTRTR